MSTPRFIKVLHKDIVTNPERWKDSGPGKFIKLPDRAKRVYCVLSVISFSARGNVEGRYVRKGVKLGKNWFWTSHAILKQLTDLGQKTVQRAIKELQEAGFIGYYPARKNGHQCFFKIKRKLYNNNKEHAGEDDTIPAKKEVQKRPVKLSMPYKEGVLFQPGRNTHDESGDLIDKNGKSFFVDFVFMEAEEIMAGEGEEAFLKYVAEENIENHLVPKYREKLAEMMKAHKVPVKDEDNKPNMAHFTANNGQSEISRETKA